MEFEARGKDICGFRPPGGESFLDLQERVFPVFNEYRKKDHACQLMVTHAGVIRVLLCHIQGLPPEDLFKSGRITDRYLSSHPNKTLLSRHPIDLNQPEPESVHGNQFFLKFLFSTLEKKTILSVLFVN